MGKFRIMPHMRLQEWVAEEKGYFADEGLDYEFVRGDGLSRRDSSVQATEGTSPAIVKQGAFESMEAGRACNVSAACHWAVNMAASAQHGRMWGHAYSVTPCGIMVPADSSIRRAKDLAGVEVGVGYHSGSHFTTVHTLAKYMPMDGIKLRFIGGPWDRVDLLLERRIQAATVFGTQKDVLEQQGFRKVVDATFMIGFLIQPGTATADVEKYFRALRRAQRDIDVEPEQFRHYYLNEMPDKYKPMVDVRAFSSGERLVFEPYTQQVYEKTHRWMEEHHFFAASQAGTTGFAQAVLV
jgi:NitT/TauT family transport system substrate-binding protein